MLALATTFIVLQSFGVVHYATSASTKAEHLFDDLLSGYYKDILPCFTCGKPHVLNITFHLTSLNYLDEVAGELNSIGYLTVKWFDGRLSWNPADYDGIVTMLMPHDKIWLPKLLVGNPSQKITTLNGELTLPRLLYNGLVIWTPGEVFHTRCYPDIYRYPFDEQDCYISFIPWGYLLSEIQLHIPENDNPLPFYVDNGEWTLKEIYTTAFTENSLNLVKFFYRFRRRPQFCMVNVILPILLLGFLNCLVFAIPANSGERISYSITVSLSFAVFMSLVGDNIPKTSDPMALLSYYLFSIFAMSALIMVCTIFNVRIFNRDPDIPVSVRYKTLVIIINKLLMCTSKVAPERKGNLATTKNTKQEEVNDNCDMEEAVSDKAMTVTWVEVSKCLDMICGVGFLCFFATSTVVQLLYIYISS